MGQGSADSGSVDGALIGNVPLFTELDAGDCQKLANIARRDAKSAGDVLFQEGDLSSELLVILEGSVRLSMSPDTRNEATVLTLGRGELLGWSALFGRDRVASAKAMSASSLLVFDADALSRLCQDDHDIGYAVMKATCEELARRLYDTRLQLIDVFRGPTKTDPPPVSSGGR
jgi:CRP/FNR family transcriptional regulator, cyclic AMP receptor protein